MSLDPSKPMNTNEVPLTVLSILTAVCIDPPLRDCGTSVSPVLPLSLPVPTSSLCFWESPVFYMPCKQLCSLSSLIPVPFLAAVRGRLSFQAGPHFGGTQSLSLWMMRLWSLIAICVRWWWSWPFAHLHALFCHLHPCTLKQNCLCSEFCFVFNKYSYFIIWL